MRFETELIKKSREFATNKLLSIPSEYHYHNLSHTQDVVEAAWKIGLKSEINTDLLENIVVGAWFHDLGYACGKTDHESASVRLLRKKLLEWGVDKQKIKAIALLIMATKMPQTPTDLPSKILCDADLYHLCQPDFAQKSESLRKELNRTGVKNIGPHDWIKMNMEFMKGHCYFTEYGKKVLSPLKEKVLSRVNQRKDRT